MSIRRVQYQIAYTHILTFRDQYKNVVNPYFSFDNVQYAIDNENSLNEGIRVIFSNENIAIVLKREVIALLFEGSIEDLKNQNGIIKPFWDIYEKVKTFTGYTKTIRHQLIVHAVNLKEKGEITTLLEKNPFLTFNPFGKLDEFGCIYEFKNEELSYKFNFGNYSDNDIKKYDLTPFKTEFNMDLINNVGLMGKLEIEGEEKSPNFSKFKSLLSKADGVLKEFKLLKDAE